MEIRMPKMNGVEASSLIMKSQNDAIIIGLCVVPDRYTGDAFMKAGATYPLGLCLAIAFPWWRGYPGPLPFI